MRSRGGQEGAHRLVGSSSADRANTTLDSTAHHVCSHAWSSHGCRLLTVGSMGCARRSRQGRWEPKRRPPPVAACCPLPANGRLVRCRVTRDCPEPDSGSKLAKLTHTMIGEGGRTEGAEQDRCPEQQISQCSSSTAYTSRGPQHGAAAEILHGLPPRRSVLPIAH